MPDPDTDIPNRLHRTLLIISELVGLALALIWWSWPVSIEPLSLGLSRTPLFSRQLVSPPVRPVIIEFPPVAFQENRKTPQEYRSKLHHLLEKLAADAPSIIAFADTGRNLSMLLNGLKTVDADPQAQTVLIPATELFPSSDSAPLRITPNTLVGLRSPDGKFQFNAFSQGVLVHHAEHMNPVKALRHAIHDGSESRPSFAYVVASRFEAAMIAGENDEVHTRPMVPTLDRMRLKPDTKFAAVGGHRLFFDQYPAAVILAERLPRGMLQNRIVLMGMGPDTSPSGETALPPIPTSVESIAFNVWALLNGQIASRPSWAFWVEVGLIIGLALCPAILLRHFSTPAAWIAMGALGCMLVAGVTVVWHLSGVMIQIGVGLMGIMLNGFISSLFLQCHLRDLPTPLGTRPPPAGPKPIPPDSNSTNIRSNKALEVLDTHGTDPPNGSTPSLPAAVAEEKTSGGSLAEKIDRYEIIRYIGKGAMGEVFLGRDPHINRLTAIKTLQFQDNFVEDEIDEIKDKFFREAESAGTLSHANIVTIYDAGEDRDLAYIAMEYLEGITLLRFTRAKRLLPVRKVIAYTAQIAEGLDYAHTQGIVHRDIKPANIMVLKSGEIKITDFGIARISTSSHTQTGVVKGTPYYMSPEQFSGAKVDGRSDIFSLGTLLFQLLTGTLPFFSESPAVLMNQIMNFPHPNPQAINPRVMPAIIPIVNKALEKQRNHRYSTAGLMAADLINLNQRINSYLEKKTRVDRER